MRKSGGRLCAQFRNLMSSSQSAATVSLKSLRSFTFAIEERITVYSPTRRPTVVEAASIGLSYCRQYLVSSIILLETGECLWTQLAI